MPSFLRMERRVWLMLAALLLVCLISLGVGIQSVLRNGVGETELVQVREDNRLLREAQQDLRGQVERLKRDFAQNYSELKTKEQQLQVAERARLQMEQQRVEKLQHEKQKQEFLLSARQKIQTGIAADDASILLKDQQLTIRLSDKVLFESGKTDLLPQGQNALKNIADFLNRELKDCPVVVEGHTDNVQISKVLKPRFPTNWELSSARASAAVVFLSQQGVDPTRLSAAGRAETQPVQPNDTEDNRAKNRRIDIVIDLTRLDAHAVPAGNPAPATPPPSP